MVGGIVMKYRICRRYLPSTDTWYVIQKRTLFGWHTLNISFHNIDLANQCLDEVKFRNKIRETPLVWDSKERRFCEIYPCKTNLIRVK